MHLSLFYRKLLRVGPTGLLFKSRHYPWSAIRRIDVWQKPWPGYGHVPDAKMLPRAKVFLSNGKSILLRGDVLVKRGQPIAPGFADAFDELVSHLHKMQHEHMS